MVLESRYAGQDLRFKLPIHGEGNGNPVHYSCLENPMGRGAWKATVHGVALKYTDDTTLMAERVEELKNLLMKVKDESEKVGLKLNV